MPLIDIPLKWVVVDIVGPIAPPSKAGYQYILTLLTTPLDTQWQFHSRRLLAQALLDIYSIVVIPKEVLTDQGTCLSVSRKYTDYSVLRA